MGAEGLGHFKMSRRFQVFRAIISSLHSKGKTLLETYFSNIHEYLDFTADDNNKINLAFLSALPFMPMHYVAAIILKKSRIILPLILFSNQL